jgi:glycosyltransferase involved in cell wall biosynthesis
LVKAFELLDSPAHLVIAGKPGWKYRELFREIKNSRKSAKIKYIGYIPEEHKASLIKLSKVLAYPSFYEGFGFQPLEAAACGVPTIVSQVTALPEIMEDSSLLVDPYNVENLAAALEAVLYDQILRKQLIQKGIEKAKDFDWDITAQRTLIELNKL